MTMVDRDAFTIYPELRDGARSAYSLAPGRRRARRSSARPTCSRRSPSALDVAASCGCSRPAATATRPSASSGTTATTCSPSRPASSSPTSATSTPTPGCATPASRSSRSPAPSSAAAAAARAACPARSSATRPRMTTDRDTTAHVTRPAARSPTSTAGEFDAAARPRRRDEARPARPGATACAAQIGRLLLREAVDPHAGVVRGGGRTGSAALPIMLRPDELQLGRGEPIADTARVLSGYCARDRASARSRRRRRGRSRQPRRSR